MIPEQPNAPEFITKLGDTMGYFWMIALAIWGGTASYITRIRKAKMPFSIVELIGEWAISGFVGVITALACYKLQFDFVTTSACAGIAGHMGARAIGMFEHYLTERAKMLAPNIENPKQEN